jgi:poly [ADP-ribose] polymerase
LFRWGRVGASGANKITYYNDFDSARDCFETMFKKKTGYSWENRHLSKPTKGKYALLEKDYESQSTKKSAASTTSKSKSKESQQTQQSGLDPRLQELIGLIFDQDMMIKSLKEYDYDESQLPLGKLTKRHIQRGYEVLKQIADVLIKGGSNMRQTCVDLSSEFYTLIPHKFGHQTKPTVIGTAELLKSRLDMVEQLMDIEIANNLIDQVEQGKSALYVCVHC